MATAVEEMEGILSLIRPYLKTGDGIHLLIKRSIFDSMEAKHRELGKLRTYFLKGEYTISDYVLRLPK